MIEEVTVKIKVGKHILKAVLFPWMKGDPTSCYRVVLFNPLPADVDGTRFEGMMISSDGHTSSIVANNSLKKYRQCYRVQVLLG